MRFDNFRDASNKLGGTIILWKGKATLVMGVDEDLSLHLRRLSDNMEVKRKISSKELKLVAPRVGYVNLKRGAQYFYRKPARMWKQGLDVRQLWSDKRTGEIMRKWAGKEFGKCYDGDYPTLAEAKKSFVSTNPFDQEVPISVAFSREWAIDKGNNLLYKGKKVGKHTDHIELNDKFVWLAESIQEVLDAEG